MAATRPNTKAEKAQQQKSHMQPEKRRLLIGQNSSKRQAA